MLSLSPIIKRYGTNICRRCINRRYRARLLPQDCQYALYTFVCPICDKDHHIVVGLRMSGHMKMLFR